MRAANDNFLLVPGPGGRLIPLVGEVGAGDQVRFFDPDFAARLRPGAPRCEPGSHLALVVKAPTSPADR